MKPPGEGEPLDQHEERLAKMEALRASGEEPYKLNFHRSHEIAELVQAHSGLEPGSETEHEVRVAGRMMTLREHGKLAFADVRDSTGRIQLLAQENSMDEAFKRFIDLDTGDWVGVEGNIMTTRRGELTVRIRRFELLSKALRPLPEKWHGLKDVELRYRHRYLDLIANPEAVEVVAIRAKTTRLIRSWLTDRRFVEVETPMLQPIPGGALAKPFVTHHEALGMRLYLRVAPELYLKRLLVGGLERIFEINRSFRNEGVSVRHNPEFTMLELYQAFSDYNSMALLLEGMVSTVCDQIHGTLEIPFGEHRLNLEPPFRRATLMELVAEAGVDPQADLASQCDRLNIPHDPSWPWGKLLLEIYEKKVERTLVQPTFVLDFPRDVSPLARQHRTDPRLTEHLDLILGGMEVAVAYSELTDPLDQRRRFEAQAAARGDDLEASQVIDEEFLHALEYGMPPAGGLGCGIDRLTMILADRPSIREVILFPALRPDQAQ